MTPAMILVSAMKYFNTMIIISLNKALDLLTGSQQSRRYRQHSGLLHRAKITAYPPEGHDQTP